MKIRKGLIKRIHVNRQKIDQNRKNGTNQPVISVQHGHGPTSAYEVAINGPSKVIYSPQKPLKCGARMWIETHAEIDMQTEA